MSGFVEGLVGGMMLGSGGEKKPDAPAPAPQAHPLEKELQWHLSRLRAEGKSDTYLKSYERGWRGNKRNYTG